MNPSNSVIAAHLNLDAPLQVFQLPAGDVWIQRDDLIHPVISGNKWRKLQGHLHRMETKGKRILVTYGGAYSNHLVASAVAAQLMGFRSIGILRGDEPLDNHYLRVARGAGMTLVGVSRALYRNKQAALDWVLQQQCLNETKVYVVAEGGMGEAGFDGFYALVELWQRNGVVFDHVFHASATATTALGLRKALDANNVAAQIHAVMVLKNEDEQRAFAVEQGVLLNADAVSLDVSFGLGMLGPKVTEPKKVDEDRLQFISGYEFGGYAKGNAELHAFIDQLFAWNKIPLDWVYTGKALFALNDWLAQAVTLGSLQPNEAGVYPVVFLHTGGVLRLMRKE